MRLDRESVHKMENFISAANIITSDSVREFTKDIIENVLPDYFFLIPASSSGRYHPEHALGVGGLARHSIAAAFIARSIFEMDNPVGRDSYRESKILSALLLHDGFKNGPRENSSKHTVTNHPLVMAQEIRKWGKVLPRTEMNEIASLIETHMGRWVNDFRTNKQVLQPPVTEDQKFVHLCDYLASRKFLAFDFGVV